MSDKFVITPIKDSKKINKVLANDTAREVLDMLAQEPMTLSQLSEKMKLPPTTLDYSIKQLESVGLIKSKTGFNKNHRIAKYYEPQEKFIILAPGKSENMANVLKNMLPLAGGLGAVSLIVEYFYKVPVRQTFGEGAASNVPAFDSSGEIMKEVVSTSLINPHYGAILFSVGLIVIGAYILWKFMLRKVS